MAPAAIHREDTKDTTTDLEKSGAVKRDYSGAVVDIDPVERKLIRKLDIRIMVRITSVLRVLCTVLTLTQPTLWLMYWLNYLDRNAIALAKLDNIDKDLGLTATRTFMAFTFEVK